MQPSTLSPSMRSVDLLREAMTLYNNGAYSQSAIVAAMAHVRAIQEQSLR